MVAIRTTSPIAAASKSPPKSPNGAPSPEVRAKVKELLLKTPSFHKLPQQTRDELAHNMTAIAHYLAEPEHIPGNTLAGGLGVAPTARALDDPPAPPPQASYDDAAAKVADIGKEKFQAGAAMAGARAAGAFLKAVNFVDFVSGLIDGVFNSIVGSSIKQMEAYATLVKNVAMSLNQFRDENISPNQGRDQVVDQFPDIFQIGVDDSSDNPTPQLQLKDGVDEGAALKRVQQGFGGEGAAIKSLDVSDPEVENRIVLAARNQMATSRQQLLATLVMMGINRIVVTDGRISAKISFDFQTRDTRKLQRSAAAYDYARGADGNLQTTRSGEGTVDAGGDDKSSYQSNKGDYSGDRDTNYYLKGTYKYEDKPVLTASTMAADSQDSQLTVKAQLAGSVDVNFKSDYLPLEKMASPGMIAAIQMNSKPVDPNVTPGPANQPPAQGGAAAPPAAQGGAPAARAAA